MHVYVIKFGTKILKNESGDLDLEYMKDVARQVLWIRNRGDRPVIVTSGAVAIGLKKLKYKAGETVSETVLAQSASTIGNRHLFNMWADAFYLAGGNLEVATMLLSNEDVEKNPDFRSTLKFLLARSENSIVVINENDVVTTEELRNLKQEGDNDILAMYLTLTIKKIFNQNVTAVFCTDVDGLYDFDGKLVSSVSNVAHVAQYIDPRLQGGVLGVSRGGMDSKIRVATKLHPKDIPFHIVNGRKPDVLMDIAQGKIPGTFFAPTNGKYSS